MQSVALLVTTLLNAHVQWSRKPRMPSGVRPHGSKMTSIGRTLSGRTRSMKRPRVRKEKGKDPSLKGSLKTRMRRGLSLLDHRRLHLREVTDPNPKLNPKHVHAWQMTFSSLWCLPSLSQHGDTQHGMVLITWSALLLICRRSYQSSKLVSGHCSRIAESPSMDMMPRVWRISHCISSSVRV